MPLRSDEQKCRKCPRLTERMFQSSFPNLLNLPKNNPLAGRVRPLPRVAPLSFLHHAFSRVRRPRREREEGEGGREAGKQARSLGHLIQLLAILLWDHYTALLLSQSACLLLPAAYPSIQGVFFVWNKAGNLSYHLRV